MYSRAGGGPLGARGGGRAGRYIKGRLPEGVGFAAYPGRSSTPMPTAESKGAERMNQLKIWNEAAGAKDGGNRLSAGGRRSSAGSGSGNAALATKTGSLGERRTDSFKEAKERHSNSFADDSAKQTPPVEQIKADKDEPLVTVTREKEEDRFADAAESDSEHDTMEEQILQEKEPLQQHVEDASDLNGSAAAKYEGDGYKERSADEVNSLDGRPDAELNSGNNANNAFEPKKTAPVQRQGNTRQETAPVNEKEKNKLCCCVVQ